MKTPSGVEPWLGLRAAAVSAGFLLANRCALRLDIDPEEFDVLEPRRYGEGDPRPLLTITDRLVNGAGYCAWLAEVENGAPRVGSLIASILQDPDAYPRKGFMHPQHANDCYTSCYHCLRRYGNQPYHGLLDWRLGMSFLRVLVDPVYNAGLCGDFSAPEMLDWRAIAANLARTMAMRFGGAPVTAENCREFAGVSAFRILGQRKGLSFRGCWSAIRYGHGTTRRALLKRRVHNSSLPGTRSWRKTVIRPIAGIHSISHADRCSCAKRSGRRRGADDLGPSTRGPRDRPRSKVLPSLEFHRLSKCRLSVLAPASERENLPPRPLALLGGLLSTMPWEKSPKGVGETPQTPRRPSIASCTTQLRPLRLTS